MSTTTRWPSIEGEDEFEFEDEFESELEDEFEGEEEDEAFVNPLRRVYPDAMALMEHLGRTASEAESEDEAEAFLPLLLPLATSVLPKLAPKLLKAAPTIARGVTSLVRGLRRTPTGRRLVRTVPTIVNRTARSLASQQRAGRPISGPAAMRTLNAQANRVLTNPTECRQALRRSAALDRRFHQHGCNCC